MVFVRMIPALLVVCVIAYFLYKAIAPILIDAGVREQKRKEDFRDAFNGVKSVKKKWLDYELGETTLIDIPSIVNVQVPEVSSFYKELAYFNEKYPNYEKITHESLLVEEFITDAKRLSEKFDKAEKKARELDK